MKDIKNERKLGKTFKEERSIKQTEIKENIF